jgi:hypothetical protein
VKQFPLRHRPKESIKSGNSYTYVNKRNYGKSF